MSNNREPRIYQENVHLFLALQRNKEKANKKCFRHIIQDEQTDLEIIEAKCKIFGGEWRIYKTVNARNVEKARIWLMKHLLDNPKNAQCLESVWKTALLQKECKSTSYFMFDVDTKIYSEIIKFEMMLCEKNNYYIKRIESPKGWHYITEKLDTREICKLDYISLLRDGYCYIKTVK